jgi:hypothetical protein
VVVGRASFTPAEAKGLKVEVNSLHRDASGVVTLVWTLRNDGGGPVLVDGRLDNIYFYPDNLHPYSVNNIGTAVGMELVDLAGGIHYQPLQTSDAQCLCADLERYRAKGELATQDHVTYASLYELPPELRTVQLQIPFGTSKGATVTGLTVT